MVLHLMTSPKSIAMAHTSLLNRMHLENVCRVGIAQCMPLNPIGQTFTPDIFQD
jgi:hypothetical protein